MLTLKRSLSLLAIFLSLSTALAAFQKKEPRKYPAASTNTAEWVVNDAYRRVVTVAPDSALRHQTPVSVDLNFTKS